MPANLQGLPAGSPFSWIDALGQACGRAGEGRLATMVHRISCPAEGPKPAPDSPGDFALPVNDSRLRVKKVQDVIQVEFLDRNILDEANIQRIGEELATIVETQPKVKLLISFAGVDHLSSAALGTLITINTKIKNKTGQLRLSDIDPQIYEVFVITKLNRLFEIHPTAADAIKSFS